MPNSRVGAQKKETLKSLLLYPFRNFWRLSYWNKWGFVSALLSVVALLGAVGGICTDKWQALKADREGRPARAIVIKEVGNGYSSLLYAAQSVAEDSQYGESKTHLAYAAHSLEELQKKLILSNRAFDNRATSLLGEFLSASLSLHKLLTYFAEVKNPAMDNFDFVSESPIARIQQITTMIEKLRAGYPDILSPGKAVAGNLKSPAELKKEWEDLDLKTERVCLSPQNYTMRKGKMPCAFNPANMAQLSIVTNTDEVKVYVMYGFE